MHQPRPTDDTREPLSQANWRRRIVLAVSILIALTILLMLLPDLPSRAGKLDFTAYWSTSYLLSKGENYTDAEALRRVEVELTGWNNDFTLKLWNLPWVVVWFIPLALLDFDGASMVWLLVNFLLLFACIAAYWHAYATKPSTYRWFWLPILAALLFPSTILVFLFGQVGLVVLAGLVGFLLLFRNSHDFSAGILLSLTTVKPHLVYLTLPLLLLLAIRLRRWKVIVGFVVFLLFSLIVGLLFRPQMIGDYFAQTSQSNLLAWQSPTLAAFLHIKTGIIWPRLIGVALLPIAILLWYRYGQEVAVEDLVNITLLASVITAPFGWSYDFVVLVLPLTRILLWTIEGALDRLEAGLLGIALVVMYIVIFRQRVSARNELMFFWIPLVIAGLYFWVRYRAGQQEKAETNLAK